MKVALLSNVNMNSVIRMLSRDMEVYEPEGYGEEIGTLLNPEASLYRYAPDIVFLVEDLMELIGHDMDENCAEKHMKQWFDGFEAACREECLYYISDAYLTGPELAVMADAQKKEKLEHIWLALLTDCIRRHRNVRIFPYHRLIEGLGEKRAFSWKMWYMGKILLAPEAQKVLCSEIISKVRVETYTPKKVLVLDLDNTLWGGLAGEHENTPIVLSEEHSGLAYKNLQRVILTMQQQGVILAIASKNNEEDALAILNGHPHMVLRPENFAIRRINWDRKDISIREIASGLNVGLDSLVFFDDNPTERQLIREMLPEVAVPEFPDRPEGLAPAMAEIYKTYFEKSVLTAEDFEKTRQYAANVMREELKKSIGSYDDYLKNLCLKIKRVDAEKHLERMLQLVNKTNQFNLTTRRYSQKELQQTVRNEEKKIWLYSAGDRFGDNGIIAVVIVDVAGEVPVVEEFAMSCRVMGKRIEHYIVDKVEEELANDGFLRLRGCYFATSKNKPVEGFWQELGYTRMDSGIYEIELRKRPQRVYYVQEI